MGRSVELDDRSLVDIFSRLGDARQIARCSLVCKRWREMCWAAARLHFDFTVSNEKDLRKKEDAISMVLHRGKKEAPGCLMELKVSLSCGEVSEATGHWLLWADSVTSLDLKVSANLRWGPSVWNLLSCFHKLEGFQITGDFHSSSLLPDQLPFASLRSCHFCRAASVSREILEALLAACPTLESLRVAGFVDTSKALILKSASLKRFELVGGFESDDEQPETLFGMNVVTPKLTALKVGGLADRMFIRISHPDSLRELELLCCGSCVLDSKYCYNVKSLKLSGYWDQSCLFRVLSLTCMITELSFNKMETTDGMAIPIGEVASRLVLESIHFDGNSLEWFQGDVDTFKFEALTVHVWVNGLEQAPELGFLTSLLGVHRIRMLVVHYIHEDMINPVSSSMNERYVSWRVLLDLMLSFPSRISFRQEKQ